MVYAKVNDTSLYYEIEGEGLPCLLLHGGLGSDHTYFKSVMPPLADLLMMCYYDHRGNGRSAESPVEKYTHETFAADADALRQHLGWDPVVMVGRSYGGIIALEYSLRYIEHLSHLILITTAPSHEFMTDSRRWIEKRGTQEQRRAFEQFRVGNLDDNSLTQIMKIFQPLYFANPERARDYSEHMKHRVIHRAEVRKWVFRNEIPKYDVRHRLQEIIVPTLVIAAGRDWTMNVRQAEIIAQGIKGARLVVFEDSGHMVEWEEHESFCEVVRNFIRETTYGNL